MTLVAILLFLLAAAGAAFAARRYGPLARG